MTSNVGKKLLNKRKMRHRLSRLKQRCVTTLRICVRINNEVNIYAN